MTDKELILKEFSEAYKIDGFPPLAGKIMGIFYAYDKKYFAFEEIVEIVNLLAASGTLLDTEQKELTWTNCQSSLTLRAKKSLLRAAPW